MSSIEDGVQGVPLLNTLASSERFRSGPPRATEDYVEECDGEKKRSCGFPQLMDVFSGALGQ